jgi:hypothetical protein
MQACCTLCPACSSSGHPRGVQAISLHMCMNNTDVALSVDAVTVLGLQ